ncbi:hypothetical protein G6L37_06010 [Agrobacterium rubi]|nr:hypothetical protein [Agrobacterium rubi]NTF24915.1 hypothetical protein [Agrobacterium rubi]
MGRELKRVALDFKWPLNKPWKGFLNPHYEDCHKCEACDGNGLSDWAQEFEDKWWGRSPFKPEDIGLVSLEPSHPAIRKFARRQVEQSPDFYGTSEAAVDRNASRLAQHYNRYRQNFLTQAEIELVRAADGFTSAFDKVVNDDGSIGERTGPLDPDFVTSLLISSPGIDINYTPLLQHMAEEKGTSYLCSKCEGAGEWWTSDEAEKEADEWERVQPPEGEGWQLWETVSEGSPVSPVFETADELATWLAGPESSEARGVNRGTSRDQWLAFLNGPGWAPSMIVMGGGIVGGVQGVLAD